MTNKYKRAAYAVSALALALSGVVVPTNVMAEEEGCVDKSGTEAANYAVELDGAQYCKTLKDAIEKTDSNEHNIILIDNAQSDGIMIIAGSPKNLKIDLAGHTLTMNNKMVGSDGYENQNWHIEKGSDVAIENGTILGSSDAYIMIQNYANLNLDNVVLDGSAMTKYAKTYVLSDNNGVVNITGKTSIIAAEDRVAFDAYWWPTGGYDGGAKVTVSTTETINGIVEVAQDESGQPSNTILNIESGEFLKELSVASGLEKTVNITGGKFKDINVRKLLSDEYYAYTTSDEFYTVIAQDDFGATVPDGYFEVKVGETYDLNGAIVATTPADYVGGWTFGIEDEEKENLALIDGDGILTAVEGGDVVVKAVAKDTEEFETPYSVTINVKIVEDDDSGDNGDDEDDNKGDDEEDDNKGGNTGDGEDDGDDENGGDDNEGENGEGTTDGGLSEDDATCEDSSCGVEVEFETAITTGEKVVISLDEDLLAEVAEKEEDLKVVYDISVLDSNNEVVKVDGNKITIRLQVSKESLDGEYKYFQIVYIDDETKQIAEYFDVIDQSEDDDNYYLTFVTTHLSAYGVLAANIKFDSAKDRNDALADAGDDEPGADGPSDGGDGNNSDDNTDDKPGDSKPGDGTIIGSSSFAPGTGTTGNNSSTSPSLKTPDTGKFTATNETEEGATANNNGAILVAAGLVAVVALVGVVKFAKAKIARK